MQFINNYRAAVAESGNYAEAIIRILAFPIFYVAAAITDLVYNATTPTKTDDNKGYVIDSKGRLHLGNSVPRYTYDHTLLDEALKRGISKAAQSEKPVSLGNVLKEIEAERR